MCGSKLWLRVMQNALNSSVRLSVLLMMVVVLRAAQASGVVQHAACTGMPCCGKLDSVVTHRMLACLQAAMVELLRAVYSHGAPAGVRNLLSLPVSRRGQDDEHVSVAAVWSSAVQPGASLVAHCTVQYSTVVMIIGPLWLAFVCGYMRASTVLNIDACNTVTMHPSYQGKQGLVHLAAIACAPTPACQSMAQQLHLHSLEGSHQPVKVSNIIEQLVSRATEPAVAQRKAVLQVQQAPVTWYGWFVGEATSYAMNVSIRHSKHHCSSLLLSFLAGSCAPCSWASRPRIVATAPVYV
jgi:hypothetical protein